MISGNRAPQAGAARDLLEFMAIVTASPEEAEKRIADLAKSKRALQKAAKEHHIARDEAAADLKEAEAEKQSAEKAKDATLKVSKHSDELKYRNDLVAKELADFEAQLKAKEDLLDAERAANSQKKSSLDGREDTLGQLEAKLSEREAALQDKLERLKGII